jgi:hypothetical protein
VPLVVQALAALFDSTVGAVGAQTTATALGCFEGIVRWNG